MAFAIGVVFFAMLQLFPKEIVSIFGTGSDLYFDFAEKYLKIYMMFVFFQNIQPVTVTYFSATGDIVNTWDGHEDWGGHGMVNIIDLVQDLYPYNGPGHWNDIPELRATGVDYKVYDLWQLQQTNLLTQLRKVCKNMASIQDIHAFEEKIYDIVQDCRYS